MQEQDPETAAVDGQPAEDEALGEMAKKQPAQAQECQLENKTEITTGQHSTENGTEIHVTTGQHSADNGTEKAAAEQQSAEQSAEDETAGSDAPQQEGQKKKRIKDWSVEDLIEHFTDHITFFRDVQDETDFTTKEALLRLCQVSWAYFDYRKHRKKLGKILLEMNYAAISKRMINYFNQVGVFRDDSIWKPCYYTYYSLWNFSDASRELAKDLAEKGHVKMLASNIGHQPYLESQKSKNVYYLLKASLSILQNISRAPEVKSYFDEANVKELLSPFLKSENDFMRATSTMVLSNIITEQENSILEDAGGMAYIILCLQKACKKSKTRRHRGFCPAELAECLGRMAVNDKNKTTIVEAGVLPLLVNMLQHSSIDEQLAASKALWTLAFDADVRQKITQELGCLEALEALSTSQTDDVRHTAKGALWVIKDDHHKTAADTVGEEGYAQKKKAHLFISYSWDNQKAVIEIKDRLKLDGYNVWIDVEQMGGSTLEAMAEAVENACVVVICVSEKYKLSPNARTEAEYTFQLKRPIVPLMMQRRYKPDGWLGMLLGSKFYINFDGKYEFDEAYTMLVRELAGRGLPTGQDHLAEQAVAVVDSGGGLTSAPVPAPRQPAITSWSVEKVAEWMDEQQLQDLKSHFKEYDGQLLLAFTQLRKEAPEFFYQHLSGEMGLKMMDILKLIVALGSLPK